MDAEPRRANREPGPEGRPPTFPREAAADNLLTPVAGHADMSDQQRIEMLRAAIKLGDEYLRCLKGDSKNERGFWTECSNLARDFFRLDFATPNIIKSGVKAICKSRLERMADGTLQPSLDELHKTIDEWNEIVIQREQRHAAQEEATRLSMRWNKVPDETKALSQRKLEEYWRTLGDPASNAEELKTANLRVAVLLSPDSPQLTSKFAEKMTEQMQSRRRDAETLVNDDDQIVITLPDMHGGRHSAESRTSPRFHTPRYARSSATIPSPAGSGVLATQDNTPQPSETPSPSLKRKRRDDADSPRHTKRKKKDGRHRSASGGDPDEEIPTPSDDEAPQSVAVELPAPVLPSVEMGRDSDSPPRRRKQKQRRNVLPVSSSPCSTLSGMPARAVDNEASTSRKAPREDQSTPGVPDREQFPVMTPEPSSLQGSRSRSKSQSSRARKEPESKSRTKSRSKSIGTDAGFHSQVSTVLGENRAGRARSRASTLPQSPPSSPSSTMSDESSDPRFTREPTDYETESMPAIVSRHKHESKRICKRLQRRYRSMDLKTERIQKELLSRIDGLETRLAAQTRTIDARDGRDSR